jgi:hypothetical protein
VTREALADALSRIARVQARVREAHLAAHVEQVALLTSDQVARYNRLRGYGGAAVGAAHPMRH